MIKAIFRKYKTQTLWLDTSFFLTIGRSKLRQSVDSRYLEIADQVQKRVNSGTLICPMSEQLKEVWSQRSLFQEIIHRITLGVSFLPRLTLHDFQTYRSMQAFHSREENIEVIAEEAFSSDPIAEMKRAKSLPFILYCDSEIWPSVDEVVATRKEIHEEFEALRNSRISKKVKFEDQLKEELLGEIKTKIKKYKKARNKLLSGESIGEKDYWGILEIGKLISFFSRIMRGQADFKDLLPYLNSEYFLSIPANFIQSAILANLFTGPRRIEHGDYMDSHHISAVLPYCHGIFVDNRMRKIIQETKLDKLYDCRVFSMDKWEDFKEYLFNEHSK